MCAVEFYIHFIASIFSHEWQEDNMEASPTPAVTTDRNPFKILDGGSYLVELAVHTSIYSIFISTSCFHSRIFSQIISWPVFKYKNNKTRSFDTRQWTVVTAESRNFCGYGNRNFQLRHIQPFAIAIFWNYRKSSRPFYRIRKNWVQQFILLGNIVKTLRCKVRRLLFSYFVWIFFPSLK